MNAIFVILLVSTVMATNLGKATPLRELTNWAVQQKYGNSKETVQSSVIISSPSGKKVRVEKVATDPNKPARESKLTIPSLAATF